MAVSSKSLFVIFSADTVDKRLEVLNIDTRDGSATASLYDVMQYPAILVLSR